MGYDRHSLRVKRLAQDDEFLGEQPVEQGTELASSGVTESTIRRARGRNTAWTDSDTTGAHTMIPSQVEDNSPVKWLLHALPDTCLGLICHDRTGTPDHELRFRSQPRIAWSSSSSLLKKRRDQLRQVEDIAAEMQAVTVHLLHQSR